MKLVSYVKNGKILSGVLDESEAWIYPLTVIGFGEGDLGCMIEELSGEKRAGIEMLARQKPQQVRGAVELKKECLLAPILHPKADVICLGINYMAHAEESARFKKEAFNGERPHAVYFSKRVNEAAAPYGCIEGHTDIVDSLDYEAELAVIIGLDAKNVSAKESRDYILGYTILNDVSARNLQNRHKQWYFGKSLDGFTPMGPCILTADSIPYPPSLSIRSRVNGEIRQDSRTDLLIFTIDHIIEELSRGMTLKAGTIISTGTPAGAGMGFVPPRFLKPGDVVTCEVEAIGSIENTVTA